MLRKRLITVMTFCNGILFRTKEFHPDYRYTMNFVDAWSVDEIVLLDVTRSGAGDRAAFHHVVAEFASRCFVPVAVGGGIRDLREVSRLLRLGADKVVINTEAVRRPEFTTEIADRYGSQCVVVAIDARRHGPEHYEVFTHCGQQATGQAPGDWAAAATARGAGEILITAIEKDGSLEGYDNELTRLVAARVTCPVLACGGAGKWQDFLDGFTVGGADAVCTTCIYHFTETSIHSAKAFLQQAGIAVRR